MEEWKDIIGYEGLYKISNKGRVWSCTYNRTLKPSTEKSGYKKIVLSKEGKLKTYRIHRLVALAFLKPVKNKEIVNHIDENKSNNYFLNLEWCTYKENMNHGTCIKRILKTKSGKNYDGYKKISEKLSVPVIGINVKTGEKIEFKSMTEARTKGFNNGHISACVNGIRQTHKGYKWHKQFGGY